MAIPLILLAVGSIVAGFVGVPHALGGSNRIETFLEPAFHAGQAPGSGLQTPGEHGAPASGAGHGAPASELAGRGAGVPAESEAHAATEAAHGDTSTELMLMGLSTVVALSGIGIAAFLFLKRPRKANLHPTGAHKILANKYYVDELYDAVIVQPVHAISSSVLWKGIDAGLIDGAVNGTGTVVRFSSSALRRVQTGSVRAYAMATFAGVVAMLGYYLWR
jgi:NADH-quinone oxidoreductase subunit L